jgi:hypothetical protein
LRIAVERELDSLRGRSGSVCRRSSPGWSPSGMSWPRNAPR